MPEITLTSELNSLSLASEALIPKRAPPKHQVLPAEIEAAKNLIAEAVDKLNVVLDHGNPEENPKMLAKILPLLTSGLVHLSEPTQAYKRVKLAEYVGWTFGADPNLPLTDKLEAILCWVAPGNMSHQMERLPDYFNDYNAIQQLINCIPDASSVLSNLQVNLNAVLAENGHIQRYMYLYLTDPKFVAEALGRTLNLW